MLLLAIGVIAGSYALISNDGSLQVINNPVSNEMDDVNENVSLPDEEKISEDISLSNGEIVKSIASNGLFHQLSNVLDKSSDSISTTNQDNSTRIGPVMVYGSDVAVSFGDQPSYGNDHDLYHIQQITLPNDNINKSDYILSPNYEDHIFIKKGQDFTDKYGMCVEADFIPLGNITIPIGTDFICHLNCGLESAYFDLSSPYVYDVWDVKYYLKNGEFPDEINKKIFEDETNQLNVNYRQLPGQNEIFLNIHDDFTDKYLLCMDCGRYVVLGNVTVPLDDVMICNYPVHFGMDNYINVHDAGVISREEALESWNNDSYLQELYSNPDYHPVHIYSEPPMNIVYQDNVGVNSTI